MKKLMAILVAFTTLATFAGCANSSGSTTTSTPVPQETSTPTAEPTEETATPTEEAVTEEEGTNVLVVYFTGTHTTEGIAQEINASVDSDLFQIIPEDPYTEDDLNYNDDNSRTTIEMNDSSVRPAISNTVENMEQYDIIFLGYPIWWGDAPRIMSTFVESYDLSGKTIIPFCASGGSGIGSSASNLEALTTGANWLEGRRFNGSASHEEIVEWINGLGLDLTAE